MNLTEIILLVTIALILGLFWQIHQLKENRAQEDQIGLLKENLQELRTRIDLLIDANRLSGVDLKNDLNRDLATLRTTLVEQLEASGRGVRETLTQRLAEIQLDTSNKLEQMRQTVDEKLHATLEQRLGESFKQVSDR